MKEKIKKHNYSLTYPKILAFGFGGLILLGSFLLCLPISIKGESVRYIDALFTATSATCITGLIPFDTFTNWSVFGQIVIITLIQIGGLGFITVIAITSRFLKRKMSLKQKMLLKESIGSIDLGNVRGLLKSVALFTFGSEFAGALILMTRFIPLAGVRRGIYMSLFTSISAFCNAGFDLMGMFGPTSSLTTVNDDPVILITVMILIVFGGLGFFVWEDMGKRKFHLSKFSAHTKLVLTTTLILIVAGAGLFLIFEYNNSFKDMPLWQKILNAFFCSITPRTAGFNSVEVASMSNNSHLISVILMFIGGSTGSTAGGVKTTTLAILVICAFTNMRNKNDIEVYGKRIDFSVVKRSISICLVNFVNILGATILISLSQNNLRLLDIIFEATSAMGTVGITIGITSSLNTFSMLVIIGLMYIGRLTSLIFALSFVRAKAVITTRKPKGTIMVG